MTDLELLGLVEKAQEAKRGERGAQGVGIREVRSVGGTEIVITLTDGRSFSHVFPKPEPGEAGAQGQPGKDGAPSTVPGPRGAAGSPGRDGTDGADGADGVSIDTAIVNGAGNLLLGFTNGSVLDVGRVVGPAGQTGERGMTGLQGPAGRDGAQFLAGEHPPRDAEDGRDGDMWMDLSSPQMDTYGPKRGGSWGPRRFMAKQPPAQENRPLRSLPPVGGSGDTGVNKTFEVPLPAGIETEVTDVNSILGTLEYRVVSVNTTGRWTAARFDVSSTEDVIDEEEFVIASELNGIVGNLELTWRAVRNVGLDRIRLYATSPVNAILRGRLRDILR